MTRFVTRRNANTRYGPWAGKILTGNDGAFQLFTVDTNGVVIAYPLGAPVESLNLIPANQDLYYVDFGTILG